MKTRFMLILLTSTLALTGLTLLVKGLGVAAQAIKQPSENFDELEAFNRLSQPEGTSPFTPTWIIEAVDAPKYFSAMGNRSLALDSNDYPHIAYGGEHLYYAWYDGAAWTLEFVDNSPGVGLYTSLALDSNDRPHISYYDTTNFTLKYARWDGVSWIIQTVDNGGDVGLYTSLVPQLSKVVG